MKRFIEKILGTYSERQIKKIQGIVEEVGDFEDDIKELSDSELKSKTAEFRKRLEEGQTIDDILPEAFAVVREAGRRVLGERAYDVQLMCSIILHQGRVAEMKTGEGKTLAVVAPAYLNAVAGKNVHMVTVNDYLAHRDANWVGKIHKFLGLSVGVITREMNQEERKKAYKSDITYGTNNQFGFDYLRDNMAPTKEAQVQGDLDYCIIDEVDSALIDEARTPLIISGPANKSTKFYSLADQFVKTLTKGKVLSEKSQLSDMINKEVIEEGDFVVDEKQGTVTLTSDGIEKAEKYFKIDNLSDIENSEIQHYINNALKANNLMHKDKDYIISNGEIVIVDDFTGRLMPGRRYSNGLHQAIEAKENVQVRRESITLASITFQNLFNKYKKLSGATGTALTEDAEFREIYGMDVVAIPTNEPVIREDLPDVIYKTEEGKYRAITDEVYEAYKKGQPVLVGTVNIDVSELLSNMFKKKGIKHKVLNAKYHEKEAEIVAQAGRLKRVTIATNMAGRGTNIKLGGNAEFMAKNEMEKKGYDEEIINKVTSPIDFHDEDIKEAKKEYDEYYNKFKKEVDKEKEKVIELGGLKVVGTERHESRRIDNQLRGRSGRQGEPGESKFFISLEDDLMRLFGSERIKNIADAMGLPEDQPIEHKMLSGAMEKAQKKVEGANFQTRKHVLEYDKVMNEQREIIYGERNKVLENENLKENILNMVKNIIEKAVDVHTASEDPEEWDILELKEYLKGIIPFELHIEDDEISREKLKETLVKSANEVYEKREEEFGEDVMRALERKVLLDAIDKRWMEHIDNMDSLKNKARLNAFAQKDPIVEYRFLGFEMFEELKNNIALVTVKNMYHVTVKTKIKRERVAKEMYINKSDGTEAKKPKTRKVTKVGRNEPCPCGSGEKYKYCCGRDE